MLAQSNELETNNHGSIKDNNSNNIFLTIYSSYKNISSKILTDPLYCEVNKMAPNIFKFIIIEAIFISGGIASNSSYMKLNDQTKENMVEIKLLESFFFPITKDLLKATSLLISEADGAKKHKKIGEITLNSYYIGILVSLFIVTPSVYLTTRYLYDIDTVTNYFNIWSASLPFLAISETNIQALTALKKYNYILYIGFIYTELNTSLSLTLTPKLQEKGLPTASVITNIILAITIPLYIFLFQYKNFQVYFQHQDQDHPENQCEHCRMNIFNFKKNIPLKILILGAPIALTKIVNHSYSIYFGKILDNLGSESKLISSIIGQFIEPVLHTSISSTSIVLSQEIGNIYGKSKSAKTINEKQEIQNNIYLKIKSAFLIQSALFSIPFFILLIYTKFISNNCEKIINSQKDITGKDQGDLESITRVICFLTLMHSALKIPMTFCDSFQKTHITSSIDMFNTLLNFAAGYYIFTNFSNHGKLIDYDYSFLVTSGISLAITSYYSKFHLYNRIKNNSKPYNNNKKQQAGLSEDLISPLSPLDKTIASQHTSIDISEESCEI